MLGSRLGSPQADGDLVGHQAAASRQHPAVVLAFHETGKGLAVECLGRHTGPRAQRELQCLDPLGVIIQRLGRRFR